MEKKIKLVETTLSHLNRIDEIQKMYEHEILSISSIEEDFKSNTYYYISAILEEKLVGFAGISILVDHADILGIAVDKNHTRKNIASTMLNHIIEVCKKMDLDNIFLEVRESNIPAINLYEKHGFKKISIRTNYYKDNNEDALIYVKEL